LIQSIGHAKILGAPRMKLWAMSSVSGNPGMVAGEITEGTCTAFKTADIRTVTSEDFRRFCPEDNIHEDQNSYQFTNNRPLVTNFVITITFQIEECARSSIYSQNTFVRRYTSRRLMLKVNEIVILVKLLTVQDLRQSLKSLSTSKQFTKKSCNGYGECELSRSPP
jgi:hypothetical protein